MYPFWIFVCPDQCQGLDKALLGKLAQCFITLKNSRLHISWRRLFCGGCWCCFLWV